MFINGSWLEGQSHFSVFNPATGEQLAKVAECSPDELEAAIAAAYESFASWSKTTAYERSNLLYKAYELMVAEKQDLAHLMTTEQGKPLRAALNEVQYAADFLLWFAEEAKRVGGRSIPSARANQRFMVVQQALGVVGAITPWNYPISMLTRKLAPALAAGCTVIVKPAESTPLCAVAVFKILEKAGFPAGVVNLVTTSSPQFVGEAFCTDPRIKKLTFTGSTEVGKYLNSVAARHMKRVSMELGGHAPAIVCADANPEHAAKGLGLVKFLNTGQACISPNRMFVHRSIYESFLQTMVERTQKLVAGNGLQQGVSIGPLINEAAIEKLERQVKDAVSKGARLLCGGHRLTGPEFNSGYFFAPTVLADISENMEIYYEETFGPIVAALAFDDEKEVIQRANDTEYGLAAYIYTQQFDLAHRLMEALNFGIIGINDINPTSAAAPFGGMGSSGLGREGAEEGIQEYLETKLYGYII